VKNVQNRNGTNILKHVEVEMWELIFLPLILIAYIFVGLLGIIVIYIQFFKFMYWLTKDWLFYGNDKGTRAMF